MMQLQELLWAVLPEELRVAIPLWLVVLVPWLAIEAWQWKGMYR